MDPTFHPTLVFSMLDEMLDAFDQGLILRDRPSLNSQQSSIPLVLF